uniref:Uncharacterized protein n=1 Tax=viral metagenome TaxID=1070528 RepID=A0A6C0D018_9ZZZZ
MYKCLIHLYIYMSGTAALAAARKRRATPQPNSNYSGPTSNSSNSSNSNPMTPIKEEGEIPKATNPTMLLMQHNILIQRLQKEVAELKAQSNDVKPKGDMDYKTEYLGLLEEMKEMKKVLLKVQSFSMETNLDVMKLKRTVEQNQQSLQSQNQDRIDHRSITITNDIESFAVEIDHDTHVNQLDGTV